MKFWNDFKKFAFKGNVFDMAVGVVIGTAFSKIITSLVADIITPFISLLTAGQNFKDLFVVLNTNGQDVSGLHTVADATAAGYATLNYGAFLQNIIDFIIIAFSIFMALRVITKMRALAEKKKDAEPSVQAAPEPTKQELLLEEIRDLLKTQAEQK